jgi:hypothetical protein
MAKGSWRLSQPITALDRQHDDVCRRHEKYIGRRIANPGAPAVRQPRSVGEDGGKSRTSRVLSDPAVVAGRATHANQVEALSDGIYRRGEASTPVAGLGFSVRTAPQAGEPKRRRTETSDQTVDESESSPPSG